MQIKYTFSVETSLLLTEQWPISVGDFMFEWITEDGRVKSICVTVPVPEESRRPTIQKNPTADVMWGVDFGDMPHLEKIEESLLTIQGVLNLFSAVEINFGEVETTWMPDSDHEREETKILSHKRKRVIDDRNTPRKLSFELVARALASVKATEYFEIPLNFLRRGTRDIHSGRYIEAFYNLFFFLETLYAPGFSNPKVVSKKLYDTPEVRQALAATRRDLKEHPGGDRSISKLNELVALSDSDLLERLVSLRGSLHHHALQRPGIWHPDRPNEFRAECLLLQSVTHNISMSKILPHLFARELDSRLIEDASNAGATISIRTDSIIRDRDSAENVAQVIFRMPGTAVRVEMVNHVNLEMRYSYFRNPQYGGLTEMKIVSHDGTQTYGRYRRY